MKNRFYRMQQKIGITQPEAAAVSVLVMLFLLGAGYQGWRSMIAPLPAFDYTEVDSLFSDATRRLHSDLAPNPAPAPDSTAAQSLPISRSGTRGGIVNINTATAAELQRLTGVGPAIAGRIIEYRVTRGPFARIDDLTRVSGIGPKTLENIRSQVAVSEPDSSRSF